MGTSSLSYVDPGSPSKFIWTEQRSIGGVLKEMQVFAMGEHYVATYTAVANNVSTATAASHLAILQGDGTNYTRVRYIKVQQFTLAGAAATLELGVYRVSTAGTGGTTISARPFDAGDTDPYGGTFMTLPTVKGTEGNKLLLGRLALYAAAPTASNMNIWRWPDDGMPADLMKPIIIAPAVAGGIAVKDINGIATATVDIEIGFTVTSYL